MIDKFIAKILHSLEYSTKKVRTFDKKGSFGMFDKKGACIRTYGKKYYNKKKVRMTKKVRIIFNACDIAHNQI